MAYMRKFVLVDRFTDHGNRYFGSVWTQHCRVRHDVSTSRWGRGDTSFSEKRSVPDELEDVCDSTFVSAVLISRGVLVDGQKRCLTRSRTVVDRPILSLYAISRWGGAGRVWMARLFARRLAIKTPTASSQLVTRSDLDAMAYSALPHGWNSSGESIVLGIWISRDGLYDSHHLGIQRFVA